MCLFRCEKLIVISSPPLCTYLTSPQLSDCGGNASTKM